MGFIESATVVLHQGFRNLNRDLFEGKLPTPALLIQNQGRHSSLGWCSNVEIWKNSDESKKLFEITICAEYLDRGLLDVMNTLVHEMVHLYCSANNIKDTSRGSTYHNKRFKEMAEKYGLTVEFDKKFGWAFTSLGDKLKELILSYKLDEEIFKIARMLIESSGKGNGTTGNRRSPMKKFTCDCEIVIRCNKDINVVCEDCGEKFEEVEE